MATLSVRADEDSISKAAHYPSTVRALDWLGINASWITDQQIRLTEIPAPEFNEARRGNFSGNSSKPPDSRSHR